VESRLADILTDFVLPVFSYLIRFAGPKRSPPNSRQNISTGENKYSSSNWRPVVSCVQVLNRFLQQQQGELENYYSIVLFGNK
jgi:hypothetical protein